MFSISYSIKLFIVRINQLFFLFNKGIVTSERIIIYLVPSYESITGGILSIFNLYKFSLQIQENKSSVMMCYYPGEVSLSSNYNKFKNNVTIAGFNLVISFCFRLKEIKLNIPEYAVVDVFNKIGCKRLIYLRDRKGLIINILNQNLLQMPDDSFIGKIKKLFPNRITCTTAHPSYSTLQYRKRLGVPIHHLPAWTYPDSATISNFENKKDLMIVSPDPSPYREKVLDKISSAFPETKIIIISGLSFESYLDLAQQAKWSLTFGEGMDDYFISTIYRGGVGFAVYNSTFFTEEFRNLQSVYNNWEHLLSNIITDIKSLDNKASMDKYNNQVRPLVTKIWSQEKTIEALKAFYRGEYSFP